MIDYNNGIDIEISHPIVYGTSCYILSLSVSNGILFSKIPTDKSEINIQEIKNQSYLLKQSSSSVLGVLFYCFMFQDLNNLDESYNDLIGMIWQNSKTQVSSIYYNATSSTFDLAMLFSFNYPYYIHFFNAYNTTLIYVYGGISQSNVIK